MTDNEDNHTLEILGALQLHLGVATAARIACHMKAGCYKNPTAVVEAALAALDHMLADAEDIRRLIGEADADITTGRMKSYDSADDFVADVIAGGEKRLDRDA